MTERKIKDLTERELIDIMQQTVRGNHIEVSGVQVNSTTDNLSDVEKTVNRLVERHKDFLLLRKQQKMNTGYTE